MGYVLGVDVGTTSIRAAWVDRGGTPRPVQLSPWSIEAPALTYLTGTDESAWVSGPGAQAAGRMSSLVRYAKRAVATGMPLPVGAASVVPERVLGHQLRWAFEACVVHLGGEPDQLVVTHPDVWDDHVVDRFTSATVGLGSVPTALAAEGEATATAWAHDHPTLTPTELADRAVVVVVDLGGSGSGVTALRYRDGRFVPIGRPIRSTNVAGIELVDAVADHLARTRAEVAGLAPADRLELARWAIGATSTDQVARTVVPTSRAGAPVSITRTEIENVLTPSVDRLADEVRQVLTLSGAGGPEQGVNHLVLAGAMAPLPVARRRLGELAGATPIVVSDPSDCVARGAALLAAAPVPARAAERGVPADEGLPSPPTERWPAPSVPDHDPPVMLFDHGAPPPRPAPAHRADDEPVTRRNSDRSDQPVSTVSRFRRPTAGTFTNVPSAVELDDKGVSELPPDRRLAVVAGVVAIIVLVALIAGRALLS